MKACDWARKYTPQIGDQDKKKKEKQQHHKNSQKKKN